MRPDYISRFLLVCEFSLAFLSGVLFLCGGIALGSNDPQCCNPAHAATPTAPAGSGNSCTWDNTQMACVNSGGNCTGTVSQQAYAGTCKPQADSDCNNAAAQTSVVQYYGTWTCIICPGPGCVCSWVQINANPASSTLADCNGDPCK